MFTIMEQSLGDQISEMLIRPYCDALDVQGITIKSLACQLKKELKAKETKIIKVKGGVPPEMIPEGEKPKCRKKYKTIIGGGIASDGVIAVDMINWTVRQNARMDAQKLLNLYPAKKVEVSGKDGNPIPVQMTNFPPPPGSIDDWQKQVEEAEKSRMQREINTMDDKPSKEIIDPGTSSQVENKQGDQ